MKRRSGTIYKCRKGWMCRVMVNGKPINRMLRDQAGKLVTGRRDAEQAKAAFVASFGLAVADEAQALEVVAARLGGQHAEMARIEAARDEEANPAMTVAAAWGAFVNCPNRPDSGPRTLEDYEAQWNRFAVWMDRRRPHGALCDVTEDDAALYAADLAKAVGASTFNRHMNVLALVAKTLRKPAKLMANPFAEIRRKRFTVSSRRELTIEELRRMCAAAAGELRVMLAIGLYTGLRLGDAATLRWGEVDLIRGVITRIPNKTARRNAKPVVVPLHQTLAAMLAETPETKRRGYVLPGMAGRYLREDAAVSKIVSDHFAACGIETTRPGPGKRAVVDVGFHSLRHSFVSLCRAANAPLSVVEAIVGHSNPAMTRHYTHTGESAARLAVDSLPSLAVPLLPPASAVAAADGDPLPEITPAVRKVLAVILGALDAGDVKTARAGLARLVA